MRRYRGLQDYFSGRIHIVLRLGNRIIVQRPRERVKQRWNMPKYKKCPRCELNYIEEDKDYCDVCLAEMQGAKLKFADLDEDEESEKTELCPVCGENYMRPGEKMCDECKKNSEYEEEEDIDPEKDEEWRNYLDEDTDDLTLESDGIDIGEDFADGFDDEEFADDYVEDGETETAPEDDFDYTADDLGDFDDEDDEDDEEDEDDDF